MPDCPACRLMDLVGRGFLPRSYYRDCLEHPLVVPGDTWVYQRPNGQLMFLPLEANDA